LTYGTAEVLTATVTTNPSSGTTPTGGTVTFIDGSTLLGSTSLSNGIATFSITTLGAGAHALTASYSGGVNFSASSTVAGAPVSVHILPAPLTITANGVTKLYGAALPALSASYSGFVNGDTATSLAALPTLTTTANISSHVGSYAITASGAVSSDYAIQYVTGTLLVTPAPLTITANNASMVQGAVVPPLSASYSGFVNGDSPTSLSTSPTLTTPANPLSPPGSYSILVGGVSSPNYAINYANGILVVTPAPVKVLKVSIQAIRLGKTKKTTQVIVVQFSGALNPGDAQSTSNYTLTTIPANKRQKSQPVALSQAQYNATTNTVTLITRKPLVLNPPIRLTMNAARLLDSYGDPLSGNSVATLSKSKVNF
jgi:hypothetical protein